MFATKYSQAALLFRFCSTNNDDSRNRLSDFVTTYSRSLFLRVVFCDSDLSDSTPGMRAISSKQKGYDQELIQSNPTSHLQKQKGKKDTHKIDKRTQMTHTVSLMNSSFHNRWSFSYSYHN